MENLENRSLGTNGEDCGVGFKEIMALYDEYYELPYELYEAYKAARSAYEAARSAYEAAQIAQMLAKKSSEDDFSSSLSVAYDLLTAADLYVGSIKMDCIYFVRGEYSREYKADDAILVAVDEFGMFEPTTEEFINGDYLKKGYHYKKKKFYLMFKKVPKQ